MFSVCFLPVTCTVFRHYYLLPPLESSQSVSQPASQTVLWLTGSKVQTEQNEAKKRKKRRRQAVKIALGGRQFGYLMRVSCCCCCCCYFGGGSLLGTAFPATLIARAAAFTKWNCQIDQQYLACVQWADRVNGVNEKRKRKRKKGKMAYYFAQQQQQTQCFPSHLLYNSL